LFEIDESRTLPQVTLQFVAANDLPGPVYKKREDLERLALKPQLGPVLVKGAGEVIVFERTEDYLGRRVRLGSHREIEAQS